jgi:hypothetical protein
VVRLRRTCRARRRPPTHPLGRPRWAVPSTVEVAPASGFMPTHGAASVSSVVPTDAHFHRWGLGFKQSSLGHITRVPRRVALDASRSPPRFRHALVPSRFRVQVSRQTQEPPSSSSPLRGDTTKRLTAHTRRACHHATGSPRVHPGGLCRSRRAAWPRPVNRGVPVRSGRAGTAWAGLRYGQVKSTRTTSRRSSTTW